MNFDASNLVVIAGPSGAGKSTLALAIARLLGASIIPRVTTRLRRTEASCGEDTYRFVSEAEFENLSVDRQFLLQTTWAFNRYGLLTTDLAAASRKPWSVLDTIFDVRDLRRILPYWAQLRPIFIQIYFARFEQVTRHIYERARGGAQVEARIAEARSLIQRRCDYDWMLENRLDGWFSAPTLVNWLKGQAGAPSVVVHPTQLECDSDFNLERSPSK